MEIKKDCPCKWVKCKRHGNCEECIAHHKTHKKYPQPFCRKIPVKKAGDQPSQDSQKDAVR